MAPASFTGYNRAGPAKSLGAWLRAAENGATLRSSKRSSAERDGRMASLYRDSKPQGGLRSTPFTRWRTKRENLCQVVAPARKSGIKRTTKNLSGGRGRTRTCEGIASGFTVRPLCHSGHSPPKPSHRIDLERQSAPSGRSGFAVLWGGGPMKSMEHAPPSFMVCKRSDRMGIGWE